MFDAYATIVVPQHGEDRREHDRLVLGLLAAYPADRRWLGYLDTGSDDVVFPDAPIVTLYAGWRYVLVEAGPEQAASWRNDPSSGGRTLPDIVFDADRRWLLSTLWDDDWRCLGGPPDLVEAFAAEPGLAVRRVRLGEDATPPGHAAR